MQITIFGASGRVGQLVVARALAEGYQVVAVTHSQNPFKDQSTVRVVQGDINDQAFVRQAVQGSQVLISCLGSWHTKTKDIVSTGTKTIIEAATAEHIQRVITLTGTAALASSDTPTFFDRLSHSFLKLVAPKILLDGEEHLRLLEASGLDWTCIRSPAMSAGTADGYVLRAKLASLLARIPRVAVAHSLVDQITATDHFRSAPVIYASK